MKKKFSALLLLLLVVVMCFSLTGCSEAEYNKELIANGTFEKTESNGWVSNWKTDINDGTKVSYTVPTVKDSKEITINNKSILTSNLYQPISVEKGATYKITANIVIKSQINGSTGFSIGFLEDTNFNPLHYSIAPDGVKYEMYLKSEFDTLNFCLRLGGKGTVTVSDVSMVKVNPSSVPATATVYELKNVINLPYGKTAGGITFAVLMTVLTVVIVGASYYMLRRTASSDNLLPVLDNQKVEFGKKIKLSPIGVVGILMFVGFVVRFILALTVYGYDSLYNQEASLIAVSGLGGFYMTNASVTPIGYLYYLGLYGLIKTTTPITGFMGISIMLKLPSILADITIIYLLYTFGKKYVGDKNASIISLLYAILPPVFMLNAGWGGTESLGVLGIIAIFICIVEKKNIGLFFSTLYSLMVSLETIYIMPLILSYLVIQMIKDKKFIIKGLLGVLAFFLAFYLITLPVSIKYAQIGYPFIVFTRYYDILVANAQSCVNTLSFYAILGQNNLIASKATFAVSVVFVSFIWLYAIYCYVVKRNRLNLILIAGFSMLAISVFAVNQTKAMAVISAVLLLVYAMISRDKRVYWISGGVFTLNAMNIFTLFDMAGYFGDKVNRYVLYNKFDWVQVLGSVLMVILVIYALFVVFDICVGEQRKEVQPIYDSEVQELKEKIAQKLKIKKAKNK